MAGSIRVDAGRECTAVQRGSASSFASKSGRSSKDPLSGRGSHYALRALGGRGAFLASWAMVLGYVSVAAFEAVAAFAYAT